MTTKFIGRMILGLLLAAVLAVGASATPTLPFTWNLSNVSTTLAGVEISADTVSTTDFLVNVQPPVGEASDQFVLKIDSFSLNGAPVALQGLNSSFALYLEGTLTLHANGLVSIYDSGTLALVADPTNNDGSLSATTSGINFSDPTGARDDITLARGSLISATFGPQANGNVGLHLMETLAGDNGFLVSPDSAHTIIDAFLFNTATSRQPVGPDSNDVSYVLVNDGFGALDLTVPEPGTLGLIGTGLLGLLALRSRASKTV